MEIKKGDIVIIKGSAEEQIYIKKERILQPLMQPMTEIESIEQRLPFEYLKLPTRYCPICGRKTESDKSYCAKDEVAKIWNRRKDDNLCVPKVNTNTDKLWDVHCYNYFESGECIWGIRDGLDRRIAELADKEAAEKICEEHNKYFSEE